MVERNLLSVPEASERTALGSCHPKTLPPCQMASHRVWGSSPRLGKGRSMHSVLLIDKFPVQAEVLGPGKWTWESEMPKNDQFGPHWFGPVGVSSVNSSPVAGTYPLLHAPLLIEHSTPKGELRSSRMVGRGQGCLKYWGGLEKRKPGAS